MTDLVLVTPDLTNFKFADVIMSLVCLFCIIRRGKICKRAVRIISMNVTYVMCKMAFSLGEIWGILWKQSVLSFTEIFLEKNNRFYLEIFLSYRIPSSMILISLSLSHPLLSGWLLCVSLAVNQMSGWPRGWHMWVSTFLAAGQTLTCQLVF